MSKQLMIEMIRERNHSASADFLLSFDQQQLASYLRRLDLVAGGRGRCSVWVREADTAPVVVHSPVAPPLPAA